MLTSSEVNTNNDNKAIDLASRNRSEVDTFYEEQSEQGEQREIFVTESDDEDGFEVESLDGQPPKRDLPSIDLLDKRTSSSRSLRSSKGKREEPDEVKKLKEKCYKIERQLSYFTKEATSLRNIADGALLERDELGKKLKNALEQNDIDLGGDGDVHIMEEEWEDDEYASDESREYTDGSKKRKVFTIYMAGVMVMAVCLATISALCVLLL